MATPQSEVVIGVMGMTGVGKSTFIKTVTQNPDIAIGNSTLGETTEVTPYKFRHADRDFVLVDTPGFNDPIESDENVAKRILEWLKESYEEGTKMSGMVYLHNLSTPRVQGSVGNNLLMFKKLVGQKGFENVILAPTFWEDMDEDKVKKNIMELEGEKRFWGTMKKKGAKVMKLSRDRECGLEIIMTIAQKRPVILQAQEEMNNQHKAIEHTSARLVFDYFEFEDFDRTKRDLLRPLNATAARRGGKFSPSPVRYFNIEEDEGFKKLKAEREENIRRRKQEIAEIQSRTQAKRKEIERYEVQGTRSSGDYSANPGASKRNGYRRSSGTCKCRFEGIARCGECHRKLHDVGKIYYHCCLCDRVCYLRCKDHGPRCDNRDHGLMEEQKAGFKGLVAGLFGR